MENYFEKYAGEIRRLQQEMESMRAELDHLRQKSFNDAGICDQGLLRSYLQINKQLFRKVAVLAARPASYFKLVTGVVVFPAKAAWYVGTAINRRVVRPYITYYFSLYLYEFKFNLRKLFSRFRRRQSNRIGIFIPTLGALAGAERFTIRLASAIARHFPHAKVDLIATNILSNSATLYDVPTVSEIEQKFNTGLEGVNIRFFPLGYHDSYHVWHANFRDVACLSREYSLFINCQHNLYASQADKSIFLCHFPHRPLSDLKPDIPRRLSAQISRLYKRSYQSFVSNSRFTQEWLMRYWPSIEKSKTSLLYPPVLPESLRPETAPAKGKIILTCGRLDPEKKILEMARIFASCKGRLKGYAFFIVGTSYQENPELKAYYDHLVSLSKQHPEIKIFENISFRELLGLYRQASIYWHAMGYLEDQEKNPIRLEHFGISVVEAMSQGCIPVVHRSGGAAQIVAEAGLDTLWTEPDEAERHLIRLANEPEKDLYDLRERLIEESKRYSEEAFEQEFLDLVKQHNLIAPHPN